MWEDAEACSASEGVNQGQLRMSRERFSWFNILVVMKLMTLVSDVSSPELFQDSALSWKQLETAGALREMET